MRKLTELIFNNTYSELPSVFGTRVIPQPLDNPYLVSVNPAVCEMLELDPAEAQTPFFAELFTGNEALHGLDPLAMKYTGHQFGQYNPDLGDGRGLLMGEVITSQGKKWDIHLKGSGQTPYSRMGDGRAVLRSSIREYLASAAMKGLGIRTTHALAVLASDTPVYREKVEPGATLIRVAESHLRFGHFEYLFYTRQHAELKLLADYLIRHHFADLLPHATPYAAMFQRIVDLTATLIADWQAVGFAHGVMNTDNMSVLGLTFDYGPYGFLDDYQPGYICNHSDYSGRYAFNQQPSIALWNLSALGYALTPLLSKEEIDAALHSYQPSLQQEYSIRMRNKLGIMERHKEDSALFSEMFELLANQAIDYTLFFRTLTGIPAEKLTDSSHLFSDLVNDPAPLQAWLNTYAKRLTLEQNKDADRLALMRLHNPKYILRNYLAQQAIEQAESGDYAMVETLLNVLANPYDEHPDYGHLAEKPPQWGKELEISCSS
ncbi:protein adenylyltransferase SelO [Photobacterium halotolerans]|uniref:Protein nucleotidyltransferase YdiU n=1 Tax=Photobacterium halotolerans TaxID=265726 RepID=A0A7X4WBK9_9GAMM|nr:YdiU family protein [Photobacterium halotolerans]NAW65696.1 YdiU family protein [Photobacterium halotolerans]NAW85194.1 YdiU family protein [Photobacterium halotolerans]